MGIMGRGRKGNYFGPLFPDFSTLESNTGLKQQQQQIIYKTGTEAHESRQVNENSLLNSFLSSYEFFIFLSAVAADLTHIKPKCILSTMWNRCEPL